MFIVESRLDKGRGPVATVLVQSGTLNKKGDIVLCGQYTVRVFVQCVMKTSKDIETAGPSIP